jgi:hypothetical protein
MIRDVVQMGTEAERDRSFLAVGSSSKSESADKSKVADETGEAKPSMQTVSCALFDTWQITSAGITKDVMIYVTRT